MQSEPQTAAPTADLGTAPATTYGRGTPSAPRKGSGGRNQYGDRAHKPFQHKPLLDAYLGNVRVSLSEESALHYQGKIRPLLRAWDAVPPEEWTGLRFEEYVRQAMKGEAPGQLKPISTRTVQMLLQAVRLFGEWCLMNGIPLPWVPDPKDPTKRRYFWQAVKKPRAIKRETKCLTLDQAKLMIEGASYANMRLAVGLALAAGCGFRKGEVERAEVEDYREKDATILVRREKVGLHHRVPVPTFVQELLRVYLPKRTGLMVGKLRNLPRDMGVLSKRLKIPRTHFHGLRHTWASELIARGAPPSVVQRLGGWSSLAVLSRYSHALGDSMKEAESLLG
jgi:integrase